MRPFILLLALAAVVGCGASVGDQCERLSSPYCTRAVACQVRASFTDCTSLFLATCCGNRGICGKATESTDQEIEICAADIRSATCSSFASQPSCTGVIQPRY